MNDQENAQKIFMGFVMAADGKHFVQLPVGNRWGFSLFAPNRCWPDGIQEWPGGIGAARTWQAAARESVPPEVEKTMGWLIDRENRYREQAALPRNESEAMAGAAGLNLSALLPGKCGLCGEEIPQPENGNADFGVSAVIDGENVILCRDCAREHYG
ncbi:MAG: hypothetical protein ACE15F_24595 [bacterium]